MQPEIRKFLYDIRLACDALLTFAQDKTLEDYRADLLLRSGVERQLEIIGEALNQAHKVDPDIANMIKNFREIINLRNLIIHGYSDIEDDTVWGIFQKDVPELHKQVSNLLAESSRSINILPSHCQGDARRLKGKKKSPRP